MSLARTQAAFWALLTRAGDAPAADTFLNGNARLDAQGRINVYADMYLFRQVDALREDFPRGVLLLGDEDFFARASELVAAQPSVHPSLGKRGAAMEALFRARGEDAFADLAALEWARAVAFLEADAEPIAVAALAQLPAEAYGQTGLQLVPSLDAIELSSDVTAAWTQLGEGETVDAPEPAATTVAVWRNGFTVFHAVLPPAEAEALRRARTGAPLTEICGAFDTPEEAFGALASWFNEGWVSGLA